MALSDLPSLGCRDFASDCTKSRTLVLSAARLARAAVAAVLVAAAGVAVTPANNRSNTCPGFTVGGSGVVASDHAVEPLYTAG